MDAVLVPCLGLIDPRLFEEARALLREIAANIGSFHLHGPGEEPRRSEERAILDAIPASGRAHRGIDVDHRLVGRVAESWASDPVGRRRERGPEADVQAFGYAHQPAAPCVPLGRPQAGAAFFFTRAAAGKNASA